MIWLKQILKLIFGLSNQIAFNNNMNKGCTIFR